ncbi:hypothetical protein F3Y22_tig00002237pilonHSYRG01558 [Hibiscus syriacus]|uniref:Uncharacterized protein n=1 Tax=Hibiscus syriacus TaxID=106335 RepID=A0A6A3CV04_HIBSY|nr:hypothetical protein F3Y22_tig00002237pilonHSYRG01558 [Hibiscus syriacus]
MRRQEQLLGVKKRPNPTYSLTVEENRARLLFSTPPSWTQQQDMLFENVASAFSLKLDSGHKLLFPWIDNVYDERLAEFSSTVPADLVDKFRARSNSLFQLMALPVISSLAIEFMRSSQLEEFLKQPLMMDCLKKNAEFSQIECMEDGSDVDYANLYYHAQKLISLCGWEPCPLPYVVNFKDGQNQFVKDVETLSSPQGYDPKYVVCARDDNFRNVTPLEGTNVAATKISPCADNDRSCNIAVKDSDTTDIGEYSIMIQACVNVDGTCKMTSREDKTCANSEQGVTTEVQTAQTNKVLTCPKAVGSNKEWKPKVISTNFGKGSGTIGASDVPTSSVEANAHSQPVSRVLDSEE